MKLHALNAASSRDVRLDHVHVHYARSCHGWTDFTQKQCQDLVNFKKLLAVATKSLQVVLHILASQHCLLQADVAESNPLQTGLLDSHSHSACSAL